MMFERRRRRASLTSVAVGKRPLGQGERYGWSGAPLWRGASLGPTGTIMPHADLIVTNARVLTMDEQQPRAEAVAIRDGAIVAVGDRAAVGETRGPATRVIDAGGNSVRAGLHRSAYASVRRRGRTRPSAVVRRLRLRRAGRGGSRICRAAARGETAAGARRRLHDPVGFRAGDAPSSRPHRRRPAFRDVGAGSSYDVGEHESARSCRAAARQGARAGQRDRDGRRRAGARRIARGRGVRAAARACRREPRQAGAGHRRRTRSQADAAGAGA